ncbi:MAG: ABC transporter substrate-binding protein [Actinomycetota bacterium]|nr:ABC transporter substrate-binding protein [Actinomycetota bacterium]
MIKFRILGSLEAVRDDKPIRLGGRKQRTLLAYLVLHANEVVTNSQLVDALWGDDPPNTATQTIHVYVSQVRKTLDNGDGSDAPLATEGAGYVLRIAPADIDLAGFQAAVKEGKAAAEKGAVEEAVALLRIAMGMWRGPALGDLAGEAALQAEATRLDEMRRGVMEELVDMELVQGRHAELIGELRALAADDPLRERFRAQLMLALYRQGRQAQALEVYDETRRLLAAELGIDPGRDLQTLHGQILRQDSTLDLPPRRAAANSSQPDVRQPVPPPARATRRVRVIVALAVAVAVLIGAAAIWASSRTPVSLGPLEVDTLALLDPQTGEIAGLVDLDVPITKIAFGYDSVWVTSEVAGTITRIDPLSRSVSQTIRVGNGASGIAFGDDAVWVTMSGTRSLARIDPKTNEVVQRLTTGNAPTDVAFAAGNLWTTNRLDGTVSQIDPASAETVRTITIGTSPVTIAGNDDALWVADSLEGSVVRLDPATATIAGSVNVGNDPSAIAVDEAIWVTNALDGTVSKISPTSNRVVSTVSVGGSPSDVAVADGTVWVTTDFGGVVVRLDADTGAVRDRLATHNRPVSVAVTNDSVWTGILPTRDVHRGGTLRIVSPFPLTSLDPATIFAGDINLQNLIYDGLVGLKRTGGPSSLELAPNLATSLPRPANGGKTYTFELRPEIRYSTGETVAPEDFRRAIERAFVADFPQTDELMPILGTARCRRSPDDCDLSRGVVTDDERSTITFHLRAPDPEFLYALTNTNTAPVPSDTPMREMDFVPSTGAYLIDTFVPNERVVLRRNPHFRQWSPVARPEGYVDEVEWRPKIDVDEAVELVKEGQADWIGGLSGPQLPLNALRTRYASQLHINPVPATYSMFLNTRVAPFDDLRVRRAINFAVDRARVVRLMGGSEHAAVTCQIQPPNLPNYEPYCPYSKGGTDEERWQQPDIAEARRLIALSGTRGMDVKVWAFTPLFGAVGRYFESLLDDLSYDASLKTDDDPVRYFGAIADPSKEIQIGAIGWFLTIPSPSAMFTSYTCDAFHRDPLKNLNHSGFCSARVDRIFQRAREIQTIDPAAAATLWSRLERAVVDLAPMVAFANPNAVDFVSERLGNYRSSPAHGLLLDQVWVR